MQTHTSKKLGQACHARLDNCHTLRGIEMDASISINWGSELFYIGDAGHITIDSGYGQWPEGIAILREIDH